MTAQEYLEGIERAERKIEAITRRLEELRTRAEGVGAIRYDKDRVQTSPQNSMPDKVIKLCEIEDKYREAISPCKFYKPREQYRQEIREAEARALKNVGTGIRTHGKIEWSDEAHERKRKTS